MPCVVQRHTVYDIHHTARLIDNLEHLDGPALHHDCLEVAGHLLFICDEALLIRSLACGGLAAGS